MYCEVYKFYVERMGKRTETVLTTCMGSLSGATRDECLQKARSMLCDHVGASFMVVSSLRGSERIWECVTITREDELTYSKSARILAGLEAGIL
jgi:hypothetical protein